MTNRTSYDVVVPTIGRPSLQVVLDGLAAQTGPLPGRIVLADDRRTTAEPLVAGLPAGIADRVVVVRSGGRGPAAARNAGWRACTAEWVAFLDDDVQPPPEWAGQLTADVDRLPDSVAASQGRIHVPLPGDRRPTDWERNVAGLETAVWATADMAYRRSVLAAVGGFDERFPRAYREDADLGLRVTAAGHRIVRGDRRMVHPVRPADRWVSVRLQKGNADDPLMRSLHGRGWRRAAGVPRGRRPWHVVTTAAAAAAAGATASGRRRTALGAAAVWTALTADFARRRIAPGPRTADEVATLALTSALVPPAATYHWLAGLLGLRRRRRSVVPPIGRVGCSISAPGSEIEHPTLRAAWPPMQALLVDRDGTIVRDVPYNGDPALVEPMPGAKAALDRVRAAGVPVAVISNQSGVGRGLLTDAQVDAVNARVSELLGPFAGWFVCRHVPGDGCACRKPEPELLLKAAAELGVEPAECVMVGDIGADVEAARRAGARGILVPTPVTLAAEVAAADETAADLAAAVALALAGRP